MRAELDDQLFAPTADTPALLSIFTLGFQGRHRVVLDALGPKYQAWWRTLDTWSQQLCTDVVNWSLKEEAHGQAKHVVHIVCSQNSSWSPPRLTLDDALDFLHRPYRLLVENAHADGAFVLSMAKPEERTFLEKRIEREWFEIETCGGIGGLCMRANVLGQKPRESLRCSVMFDCDAMEPGVPSIQARAAKEACDGVLHYHMLQRRAIENYLPLSVLRYWCGGKKGKEARQRKAKVRAFSNLSPSQRHHLHMKGGLEKDNKLNGPPRMLYAALNKSIRARLSKGFGSKIAELFSHDIGEVELKKDGGWDELRPFLDGLIERVR